MLINQSELTEVKINQSELTEVKINQSELTEVHKSEGKGDEPRLGLSQLGLGPLDERLQKSGGHIIVARSDRD